MLSFTDVIWACNVTLQKNNNKKRLSYTPWFHQNAFANYSYYSKYPVNYHCNVLMADSLVIMADLFIYNFVKVYF